MRESWRPTSGATDHRLTWSTLNKVQAVNECKILDTFLKIVSVCIHHQSHEYALRRSRAYELLNTSQTLYNFSSLCLRLLTGAWTRGKQRPWPSGSSSMKWKIQGMVRDQCISHNRWLCDLFPLRKHQEQVPRNDRESKESMGSGRTKAQEP